MEKYLIILKKRFLPLVGWVICSFISIFLGWVAGSGIGYFSEFVGWVKYSDEMFSGMNFLLFPFIGGIIGLIAMHATRVLCWMKLDSKFKKEHEEWTFKNTIVIAIIDEIVWLISFAIICLLFTVVL